MCYPEWDPGTEKGCEVKPKENWKEYGHQLIKTKQNQKTLSGWY